MPRDEGSSGEAAAVAQGVPAAAGPSPDTQMIRLSTFDPTKPFLPAGTLTTLRSQTEWAGSRAQTFPPLDCVYDQVGHGQRMIVWHWMHFEVARDTRQIEVLGQLGRGGLPVVREHTHRGGSIDFEVHPDWVSGWTSAPPVSEQEPECRCDYPDRHDPGCLWNQWNKARKAKTPYG